MKVNIFCRPEETMLETGKSLSPNKIIFCFKRKLEPSSTKIIDLCGFAINIAILYIY